MNEVATTNGVPGGILCRRKEEEEEEEEGGTREEIDIHMHSSYEQETSQSVRTTLLSRPVSALRCRSCRTALSHPLITTDTSPSHHITLHQRQNTTDTPLDDAAEFSSPLRLCPS